MKPESVMEGKFDWNKHLQAYLWNSGVVVSKLHPIMGLRVAALFVHLENHGFARQGSGGTYQIFSGVRTRSHQKALYEDICLSQRRCAMVADYRTNRGPDCEGVIRYGSNHMAQRYPSEWGNIEVGHAIDITNGRKTKGMNRSQLNAAWKPCHDLLPIYGLDYPLDGKGGRPLERWHIEANPRNSGWIDGKHAWPKRPGVHRPIYRGVQGGDAKILQRQCCELLGLHYTTVGARRVDNDILGDGDIGPVGIALIKDGQGKLGRATTGVWNEQDQLKFESLKTPIKVQPKKAPAPKLDTPAPKSTVQVVNMSKALIAHLDDAESALDGIRAELAK